MKIWLPSLLAGIWAACATGNIRQTTTDVTIQEPDSTIVALKMCVHPDGTVLSTEFLREKSTTIDTFYIRKAQLEAQRYRFAPAPTRECGEITFKFREKT